MTEKIIGKITEDGEYVLLNEAEGWILETIDENGEIHTNFVEDTEDNLK